MARRGRDKASHTKHVHPTSGYTATEEAWNSITHGVGLVWAVVALVLSVAYAVMHQGPWLVTACSIYGASLIVLYLSSFVYHTVRDLRLKRVFLVLDHACIYLLIAGTYTPFTLGPLRGTLGWVIFAIIWTLAILGVVREIFKQQRGGLISSLIYLAMGWLCLVAIVPLFTTLSPLSFVLLVVGGVTYSLGVIFYLCRSLKYHHAIWHLFVLGGSACHWVSIMALLQAE